MIQWVYEGSAQVFDQLVVATDDRRIYDAVEAFNGRVVMTSSSHQTGTERCAEALKIMQEKSGITYTHVINIQGDEPLIKKEQLLLLKECLMDPVVEIATLIRKASDPADIQNPNMVKVVTDQASNALYFSRSPIPFIRDSHQGWTRGSSYFVHLGLYGFRADILSRLVTLPPTPLESAESLEQLRWMEHGFTILTRESRFQTMGVDTPEDLEKLNSML
jgi:3-deoxy-manno-octulosonate cytidylyltransferase (CMP-KDO synthetase)